MLLRLPEGGQQELPCPLDDGIVGGAALQNGEDAVDLGDQVGVFLLIIHVMYLHLISRRRAGFA